MLTAVVRSPIKTDSSGGQFIGVHLKAVTKATLCLPVVTE